MSALAQRAIEARANAWSLMNDLRSTIAGNADGLPTAEQSAEWDRLEAEISARTEVIDREARAAEVEARLQSAVEDRNLSGAGARPAAAGSSDERAEAYRSAFIKYVRHGISEMDRDEVKILRGGYDAEVRAQSEGTTTAGGYLVPQDYWVRITEVMKAYGGLQGVSNQITTSGGRILPWPKNDDTANEGVWLGENTQVTSQDLSFTQNNLQAWTASSNLVLVSLELLQDSAFDLDSWIPKRLGVRIGRVFANAFMNGSGSSQPTGLLPAVTNIKTGATGASGAFSYDNLVDLQHSVDPAYRARGNCRFMFNDQAVASLRKLTDNYGHPLWQPSISQAAPDFLLGDRIVVDQSVPAPALSAKSVLYGDFESAYVVRNVRGGTMMRLTERYADYLQVGFFGFMRVDGKPDDLNAVAVFQGAAT